jgi:hypothetical protein
MYIGQKTTTPTKAVKCGGLATTMPQKNNKESIYGSTQMGLSQGLPYIITVWIIPMQKGWGFLCRRRTSSLYGMIPMQKGALAKILSGNNAHKNTLVRVSTDQQILALSTPMSPFMAHPDGAYKSYLPGEFPILLGSEQLLNAHPKIIAHK